LAGKTREHCYYCGGPKQSREHVPPQQFFKGFDCDSITVPSCNKHNSNKGMQDQAIVTALLLPFKDEKYKYPLEKEIILAIKEASSSFELTKRNVIKSPFLRDPPTELKELPDLAFMTPSIAINAWVRQLTAALLCNAVGWLASSSIQWLKANAWTPDLFTTGTSVPAPLSHSEAFKRIGEQQKREVEMGHLSWIEGWSAKPRPYPRIIYSFQVHFGPKKEVVFRHRFYNRYTSYVRFNSSTRTIVNLRKFIDSQMGV
jgi:hypothetical protein